MPQPICTDFKALNERLALPGHRGAQRRQPKQLFPIPKAKDAQESAQYVLQTLRAKSAAMTADQRRSYMFGTLRHISPFTLEQMIVQCFEDMGYQTIAPQFEKDGGIDGAVVDHDGAKILLQTKRYSGGEARYLVKHLRDFIAVVAQHKAQQQAVGGFFLHTGKTGLDAHGVVAATRGLVTLFSGDTLLDLLLRPTD